jgi:hypothetical protein
MGLQMSIEQNISVVSFNIYCSERYHDQMPIDAYRCSSRVSRVCSRCPSSPINKDRVCRSDQLRSQGGAILAYHTRMGIEKHLAKTHWILKYTWTKILSFFDLSYVFDSIFKFMLEP